MDFKNAKFRKEEDLPVEANASKYDYTSLIKGAQELKPGLVMTIPIKKPHHVQNIRGALTRYDKKRKYRVTRSTIDGQIHAVVKLADGHK